MNNIEIEDVLKKHELLIELYEKKITKMMYVTSQLCSRLEAIIIFMKGTYKDFEEDLDFIINEMENKICEKLKGESMEAANNEGMND